MIEYLKIKNLVLMDLCEAHFDKGLTIITGETGAGKTALTEGLKLILGERVDSSMVRKGEDKAHVEAWLSIAPNSKILPLLEEYGIDANPHEPLVIRREISSEGKSRAFINQQMVTASVLQSIASHLIDIIGQHSYHALKSSDTLRDIIDLFGDIQETLSNYQRLYSQYKGCEKKQQELKALLIEKERNFEICQAELTEIVEAKLNETEEEELFATYSFHAKAQEIGEKGGEICRALTEGPRPIIRELSHFKNACDHLCTAHASFAEARDLLKEAIITLQEVDHILQRTLSSLDHNPLSAEKIEQRLSLYTRIKKKYGNTFQDWKAYQTNLEHKLRSFDLLDVEVENASREQAETLALLRSAAKLLTEKRRLSAKALAIKLSSAIPEMNMPGAEVIIDVTPEAPTSMGEDLICFWLQANKGEKPSSLKESTSGGELSRLLLAIKTTLAEKNNTPTIIFDEIDANVGGTTATLIGEKLLELSTHRQVFCITHFPQVAKKANLHLSIYKQTEGERTLTRLEKLDCIAREKELLRMLGGQKASLDFPL